MDTKTMDKIIAALEDFYVRNGNSKSIEYTFGFFDALRVVQDMKEGRA